MTHRKFFTFPNLKCINIRNKYIDSLPKLPLDFFLVTRFSIEKNILLPKINKYIKDIFHRLSIRLM